LNKIPAFCAVRLATLFFSLVSPAFLTFRFCLVTKTFYAFIRPFGFGITVFLRQELALTAGNAGAAEMAGRAFFFRLPAFHPCPPANDAGPGIPANQGFME